MALPIERIRRAAQQAVAELRQGGAPIDDAQASILERQIEQELTRRWAAGRARQMIERQLTPAFSAMDSVARRASELAERMVGDGGRR